MNTTTQKYSTFIANLRQMGFIIGTGHYLQLQAVLNLAGEDASDLKYLLCPVFAKSEKQQAQFYLAFDSFFAPSVKARIPDKDNAEAVQITTTPSKWKYFILGILLLANLVLFALARDDIRFAWESMKTPEVKNQPGEVKPPKPPDPPKTSGGQNTGQFSPTETPKTEFYQQYWQIIRWIAILMPILIFLLREWYHYDRRKLILQRESSRKPPYTYLSSMSC